MAANSKNLVYPLKAISHHKKMTIEDGSFYKLIYTN
jgi:hypothetical protein